MASQNIFANVKSFSLLKIQLLDTGITRQIDSLTRLFQQNKNQPSRAESVWKVDEGCISFHNNSTFALECHKSTCATVDTFLGWSVSEYVSHDTEAVTCTVHN